MAVFLSGRQKEAGKLFERLPKKSGAAWYYLGLVAFNGGDFQKAVDRFDRAVAGSPDDYYSHLYRASSLLELNRLKEARSALERLLKIADIPEVNRLLGQAELRAKRFPEAEAHFGKAVKMSPNNAGAQFGLATALRLQGETEEAREAFKKFRQLHVTEQQAQDRAYALEQKHLGHPKDPGPPEELARHYLAHNDAGEAERLAWRSLHIEPSRVSARLCLARSLTVLGRYREAAAQYQRIIRTHPGHTVAREEFRQLVRKFARRVDD
jgi:Flp pilus assembly protein TadD